MASNPNPLMPAELAEIIATHTALFGGFTMMADETPDAGDAGDQQTDGDGDDSDAAKDDLGDAGKRALAAERRRAKQAEKDRDALQAQLDKIADADKSEAQKATDRAAKAEEERDALAAQLDALRREQAVYRHADTADPAALLDSRAFLDSIADIDADDDKAIQAAIKQAVKDNPRLSKLGQSGGDASAGQRQQANPNTTAPGVHRMAAAFDAHLGTA